MNYNHYLVFDLETGGLKEDCEILQIAAVILDGRRLNQLDTFQSLIKPEFPEKVNASALKVNRLTLSQLEKEPSPEIVWSKFVDFCNKYNQSKSTLDNFKAVIPCGFNIVNFDLPILTRYAKRFGPWDTKRNQQKLWHQRHHIDLFQWLFTWFENNSSLSSLKLTNIAEYMGVSKEVLEGAHDALFDTKLCAEVIVRLLKMQRYLTSIDSSTGKRRLEFKGKMKGYNNG